MFKHSVILSNVGSCCDRYMSGGYARPYTLEELFGRLSAIKEVKGVELIGNWNIRRDNVEQVKEQLQRYGYYAVSIIPDHFGQEIWGKGAFTSHRVEVRKKAVEECCSMIDLAREINCPLVSIWNGQDGYDYPAQVDYDKTYQWLVEGIKECARYASEIRIALEYKPKEPRNHSFISNVYSTLNLISDVGEENVGVTLDTGHSLEAYENIAETACAALRRGKLYHLHMNDNYRLWDDDMITGSIHTIEYIELFYWLNKHSYKGWISTDQYPYREDSVEAVRQSLNWFHVFEKLVDKMDKAQLQEILDKHDAVQSVSFMRELMFGV